MTYRTLFRMMWMMFEGINFGLPSSMSSSSMLICDCSRLMANSGISTNICVRFREKSVSRPQGPMGFSERDYCQSRGIAAATMIYKILRNIKAHGHVARFTGLL